MKKFRTRAFWISRDEISETMKRGGIATVTAAVRLLVPDMCYYKCARGGYWGIKRGEWGAVWGTRSAPHAVP